MLAVFCTPAPPLIANRSAALTSSHVVAAMRRSLRRGYCRKQRAELSVANKLLTRNEASGADFPNLVTVHIDRYRRPLKPNN